MPPKPQTFKTPDGKVFDTRAAWRDYMMATFYTFKNKKDETCVKSPGDIGGQMFDIADCEGCTLIIMDNCEQVQMDNLKNCRVFLGACASSCFIRDCENCTFYTVCRQLRLRDIKDSSFYNCTMAEVHIELSKNVRFGPFNGGYPEHESHVQAANLDTTTNLWYDIFDHNDPGKTHENWSIIPVAEYEPLWFPAGAECIRFIQHTAAAADSSAAAAVSNSGMQAFSFDQLVQDASQQKAKETAAPVAPVEAQQPIPPVPPPAPVVVEDHNALVLAVVNAFADYKSGNDLTFATPDFCIVLPTGVSTNLSALEVGDDASCPLWHLESITIAGSKDLAVAVFWVGAEENISKCTGILTKTITTSWQMQQVQCSDGVPAAQAAPGGVLKKLTLA